ncbi:MAG: helix-turn-helix domain-containing protein [Nanoarchaeota archaeon]|nr:helix-turn-helix domain-containing protein [Nanoarchaeota archaeon]
MLQPQEIEVWYILPAIRRELAMLLTKKHGLSQKDTAKILNVSAPAVSQYMKSKRASEVKFTKNTSKLIEKASEKIFKDNSKLISEIQILIAAIRKDLTLCRIHKNKNKDLPAKCCVCLREIK